MPYHINVLPGWRSIFETIKGNLDGEICRYAKFGDENPNLIKIIPSIYFLLPTVYSKKNLNLKEPNKDSYKEYRVGIFKGLLGFEEYLSNTKSLILVNSVEQLIQMLLLDRIDLFITSPINASVAMTRMKAESKIKYAYPIEKLRTPLYHFLSNKFHSQADILQNILHNMEESGELKALQKHYEIEEINRAKTQEQ